jgi:hypothetical protein
MARHLIKTDGVPFIRRGKSERVHPLTLTSHPLRNHLSKFIRAGLNVSAAKNCNLLTTADRHGRRLSKVVLGAVELSSAELNL